VPTKTCLHVFLAAVRFLRVLKHVSMPFFATVRFLRLLKHVSMPLSWCRMIGRMFLRGLPLLPRRPQYPLLWLHRIPAPSTGGTRPPSSQSVACGEPVAQTWDFYVRLMCLLKYFYLPFFCCCKVSAPAKICFYSCLAAVRFLRLLKFFLCLLLWCRMAGMNSSPFGVRATVAQTKDMACDVHDFLALRWWRSVILM